ncbi:MAG: succinylglutamate desuccinylase/aspartoacylase family protein, partial [Candidatus Omnitrophica bacterium]|nr:succinylglutamate desuccinylase/aspartoacylase family protein [Candidatus Omnitrophota bacterium]
MKIGRFTFKPGRLVRASVILGPGSQRVTVQVWIAAGRQSGKTLFLSAGIHGDEVNAITLLQR